MSVEKSFPDKKRSVRGYDFEWTDKHFTAEELMPLRHQADDLALAVVEKLLAIVAERTTEKGGVNRPDLYEVLKENYPNDDILRQFWEEAHTVPDWVDWEEIEKGQAFLYRYLAPNITGIVLQGCLGENAVRCILPSISSCTCAFLTTILPSRQRQAPQRSSSELEASTSVSCPSDSSKPSSGRFKSPSPCNPSSPAATAISPPFACGSCMPWCAIGF